jgi:pimeloyl-ACP methyl ester carboxylesterase
VIYGTMLIPDGKKNFPFVLIIAGSGPTDRDGNNPFMKNNSYKMLAETLGLSGIASIRYDKRLIAKSAREGLSEESIRFKDYVLDAEEWIKWIQLNYPKSPVFVAGHSEGSLVGMSALQTKKSNGFISLAGVGRSADVLIKEQLKAQPQMLVDLAYPIIDSLKLGIQIDTIHPFLYTLFRPSVQPYIISWFKYDPVTIIQQLDVPCLIIQGSTDIQVAILDAELLAKANSNSQLEIIEGMNHVLKEAPPNRLDNIKTYNDSTLVLHPNLAPIVKEFILNNAEN